MRSASAFLFSAVLFLVACRDVKSDDTVGPDTPGGLTIQEVQNEAMAPGTAVELRGVVVTAIDAFGSKTGDIWVQEPEGGPNSGVHVFNAPLDQVAQLALGDIIDLDGAVKDEFALQSDTSGNTVTELKPASGGNITITRVSGGTPLAPQIVDALAIGQLPTWQARAAEWEKWEGVLISVTNVSALGAPACVGSGCSDKTLEKFDVTGDLVVESALAAFPTPKIVREDCLGSVTGVVDYFFDYLLLPRTTAELATGGSGCPAKEASATACHDGVDNDGNGFGDCADNNCIPAEPTCRTVTTIANLQMAATPPAGGIEIQNAYVAMISKNKKNLWVQTGLTAAANEGIYVYGTGADLGFAVGSKVNIIGTVTEFNDATGTDTLTEVNALTVTAGTAGTGTIVPVTGQTVTTLSQESYESTLVKLTNVKITTVGTNTTFGVGAASQFPGDHVFKTDDDLASPLSPVNTCYASVTGIWTYLPFENAWGLLPSSTTTAGGGNCQ